MKFHVRSWEDEEAGHGDQSPVSNAYQDTLDRKPGGQDRVWLVDIESLDELLKFIHDNGRVVIEDAGYRTSDNEVVHDLIRWQSDVAPQTSH